MSNIKNITPAAIIPGIANFLSDIYWVFWREIKRFFQHKARISMAIVQPVVWLVLMGNAMSGLTNNPVAFRMMNSGSYLDFITPGIMIMTALFVGVSGGSSVIWDRRLGFLNKMFTSPVYRAAIPIGKMLAIAAQIMLQALFIIIIAFALGVNFRSGFTGIIGLLFISCLFGIIMGSISLSLASVITSLESLFAITNFLTMPLIFTSNAIYPISAMPAWLRWIAEINPLTYAVATMRTIASEGWIWINIIPGLSVLCLIAAVSIFISIRMFYRSVS